MHILAYLFDVFVVNIYYLFKIFITCIYYSIYLVSWTDILTIILSILNHRRCRRCQWIGTVDEWFEYFCDIREIYIRVVIIFKILFENFYKFLLIFLQVSSNIILSKISTINQPRKSLTIEPQTFAQIYTRRFNKLKYFEYKRDSLAIQVYFLLIQLLPITAYTYRLTTIRSLSKMLSASREDDSNHWRKDSNRDVWADVRAGRAILDVVHDARGQDNWRRVEFQM